MPNGPKDTTEAYREQNWALGMPTQALEWATATTATSARSHASEGRKCDTAKLIAGRKFAVGLGRLLSRADTLPLHPHAVDR